MGMRTNADELVLLRRELQAMTDADLSEHRNRLRELSLRHPNSITLLDSPHPIVDYTCLMHALDLVGWPDYKTFKEQSVSAGRLFAHNLVLTGVLAQLPEESATAGDIVLYFGEGGFQQAGRLLDRDRVVSQGRIHATTQTESQSLCSPRRQRH